MINRTDTQEMEDIEDIELFRALKRQRASGALNDSDRIRLFSPFGHGANERMFKGICRANYLCLNPSRELSDETG